MQHLQPSTTLQGGKYRIERVLGQGGFGITYLAMQTSLQRKVAIKEFFMKDFCSRDDATSTMMGSSTGSNKLVEQYKKKFVKEARNLAKLSHPNIINVIDVFEENDTVYYAMPYLSGGSLQDYVKSCGALSETEALKYVRQIAKALKYMHEEQHMCHYDVKPANILLDDKGNAVLIDFGISKGYDEGGHETSTTPIGLSEGYAPIEQYQQGLEEFSPASDVYALGATLYFLLHGKAPISAIDRVSGKSLSVNSSLSESIKRIIDTSMKLSKQERAKSVNVFMNGVSSPPSKAESAQEKKSYGWLISIAQVVVGFVIGYYIFINYQNSGSVSSEKSSNLKTIKNEMPQRSEKEESKIDSKIIQHDSESFTVRFGDINDTYSITVDDGNVVWAYKGNGENRKGSFRCNPIIDADIIIAECKSILYWEVAGHFFWKLAEELGYYRYDEFQLAKKALGLSASYMSQARQTCPNAFEHVQSMYQDLVNEENGGDIWEEITLLSYALGEHPLEPCDLYDPKFY